MSSCGGVIEWCKTGHFGQGSNGYFIYCYQEEELFVFLYDRSLPNQIGYLYSCTIVTTIVQYSTMIFISREVPLNVQIRWKNKLVKRQKRQWNTGRKSPICWLLELSRRKTQNSKRQLWKSRVSSFLEVGLPSRKIVISFSELEAGIRVDLWLIIVGLYLSVLLRRNRLMAQWSFI